jgi:hypothetical protein
MCVACSCNIFGRCLVLKSKTSFSDHLARIGTDDVASKNGISLLLDEEFDESVLIIVGLRSGVGNEWELVKARKLISQMNAREDDIE